MRWKVTEQPTEKPISLLEAKEYLRVQHTDDDYLIGSIIDAAVSFCEEELDLSIMEQQITMKLDRFPDGRVIDLPRSNLLSVTSVTYNDAAGAGQTFSDYTEDAYSTPGRIVNNTSDWPETEDKANSVTIVYQAGFGSVPAAVIQATRMLVTHWYENRSTVVVGEAPEPLQMAVTSCLQKFRRMGL